jgi:aminoacylase
MHVVPTPHLISAEAEAGFDVRLPVTLDLKEFEARLNAWTSEDDGVSITWTTGDATTREHFVTSVDAAKAPWWRCFLDAASSHPTPYALEPEIFPAGTDGRYLREAGVPVLGFSPLYDVPCLLHDHDEYVTRDVFLRGVGVYEHLIEKLCDFATFDGDFAPQR